MMIDCGAWQGSKEEFSKSVRDLKQHIGNRVDLLVVTHEHKDHVLGFELCEDLFTKDFEVGQTWMAWVEEDGDPFVEDWKKKDGLKKQALAAAAQRFQKAVVDPNFEAEIKALHRGAENLTATNASPACCASSRSCKWR
jgi:glyoxylase-like metal-dependent hydrolase (beta-lactamase superfamily II)